MSKNTHFIMKRAVGVGIIIIFIIIIMCIIGMKPVSKNSKEVILDVKENSSYLSIAEELKNKELIKSKLMYKIYVKLSNPKQLETGIYKLNQNMGIKKIVEKLELGSSDDVVTFTIPEGKHITDVASYISKVSNLEEQELLNYWQDKKVINQLKEKYWFITDEVKNKNLRYSLEGYFFPATYEIYHNSSKEEVTLKMLDKMDEILSKYKNDLKEFTIHELLTLSSIVEHEAILDEDRPKIAKVFINRLNQNIKLQSCATIGYAINEWKVSYNLDDLNTDSFYNTYMYEGLPVGPAGMPGEQSIKAVIYPDENDYLYFLANVYDKNSKKTYYSNTYAEHQNKCLVYLGRPC